MFVKHFEDVNKRVNVNYWLPSTTVTVYKKKKHWQALATFQAQTRKPSMFLRIPGKLLRADHKDFLQQEQVEILS